MAAEKKPLAQEPVKRTYYSSSGNLCININIGKLVLGPGGVTTRAGQKVAQFGQIGQSPYGLLVTDDPEIIDKLDKRIRDGKTDVFESEEYERRTTPLEMRLDRSEKEKERVLSDHNRLLSMLREAGVDPETGQKINR